MSDSDALAPVKQGLVDEPKPLIGAETIQLVLVREVQDYTILRTEETRELNTVWTLKSEGSAEEVERVAFLASKQKGAESRELESLLRTWNEVAGRTKVPECYLKSQLCKKCPRCLLFGATDVAKGTKKGGNIKHRIAYATAFSLLPVDPTLREVHTFNGVDGATQLTGQTLGSRESVRPGNHFASVVTLRSATKSELALTVRTLLSCTRYGAESRIGGFVRNHIVGVVAGHEEIVSPLELTLALGAVEPTLAKVHEVLENYKAKAGNPGAVRVLTVAEVTALIEHVQKLAFDKSFLDAAYKAAEDFDKEQQKYLKKVKD